MLRDVAYFLDVTIDSTDATFADLLAAVAPFAIRDAFDKKRASVVAARINQNITDNLAERTHEEREA